VLLTKDGYIQGFNAQAAVDATAQIIVAHALTASMSDHGQLVPLIDAIEDNLGRKPKEASADSGYLSEENLKALAERGISAYIATGRAKHPTEVKRKIGGPLTQAMREKLKREDGAAATDYESKSSSRCSVRSSKHGASGNSSCAASRKSGPNGR
jgi:hypothetical protein